ncbi:MAG: GNAT family N-acetyltransferase [Pseudomonadales bacterium]
MTDSTRIRAATAADEKQILALLPQLADFDVPPQRNPDDLWQGDAALVKAVFAGENGGTIIEVAEHAGQVQGVIVVTLREELMSHAPSAHLEAIVVHPDARGIGLGQRLLDRSEALAREHGAQSLSLHVFANNHRARALYQSSGFDQELIRAIKWFS